MDFDLALELDWVGDGAGLLNLEPYPPDLVVSQT